MSKRMTDVKKWYVLVGCEENDDTYWHIEKWDHSPESEEVDVAVSSFNDANIHTYFLFEETARGKSSVRLTPLVEQPPVPKKEYKMPPMNPAPYWGGRHVSIPGEKK